MMPNTSLHRLFERLSEPIVALEADHRLRFANGAFRTLLGLPPTGPIEVRLHDLVHGQDRAALDGFLSRVPGDAPGPATAGETSPFFVRLLTTEGQVVPQRCHLEMVAEPAAQDTDDGSAGAGYLVFLATQGKPTAGDMRRQFISLIHHELKTPLTSILGASRLLQSGAGRPPASEDLHLLDILARNSLRLGDLVDNLLDLQRLAQGELHFHLEAVALQPLLDELQGLRRGAVDCQSLPLDVGPPTKLSIYADRRQLLRGLGELLLALDRLLPKCRGLQLRLSQQAGDVLIGVRSLGADLPYEVVSTLSPRSKMIHGHRAGLRLELAMALIQGMGGRLYLEAAADSPTLLTLRLAAVPSVPLPTDSEPSGNQPELEGSSP